MAIAWLLSLGSSDAALRGCHHESDIYDIVNENINKTVLVDEVTLNAPSYEAYPHRELMAEHMFFQPLSCNVPKCNAGSTTWKALNIDPSKGKVVIECGKCVRMDYDDSDTLILPHGIDIQGSLRFANGYRLTIVTPFVLVQGVLELFATRKVTHEPNIKFLLTGTDEQLTQFVPAGENEFSCSMEGAATPRPCSIGRKPFVVAGGRVDIKGLPSTCPTWVKLQETFTSDIPEPIQQAPAGPRNRSNPRCLTSTGIYMEDDFSTSDNVHGWTGGYGALSNITEAGTFVVANRKDPKDQNPTWDMLYIRDCINPDTDYLFRARVKLTKAGAAQGTLTTCATTGTDCMTLQSMVHTPTRFLGSKKGSEDRVQQSQYGVWQDFHAVVTFTTEELDPNNIYQILQLRGPEAGVIIEIDDVRFSLPPAGAVPDPNDVCGTNLVRNGDAELDSIHPYPIDASGGSLTVEEENNGNKYFHLSGRNNNGNSVIYEFMAPDCLVPNAQYRASARIRMNSSSPVLSKMEIRTVHADGTTIQRTIAECPPSTSSTWTLCHSLLTIDQELLAEGIQSIRLQFETFNAATIDMDVDDMKLSFTDGSITSILVPDAGVSNCWDKGAELLITSHTLDYDDGQVRRLVSSPIPTGDGYVMLELDSAIVPPISIKDSADFAVEVALLSRNIVFEGDTDDSDSLLGAHFMVFHTPHVQQYIEGIELKNFGQQGRLGRYPIHFHMSGNVDGAVVSKNSIRESNQRCVVIHGSHNVSVVDNVSYDTFGHCFMTEDGGEIDNVFQGNLGALTKPASRLVGPLETDNIASTYWCSNPNNEWIGNVAAGCRDNGFWFELNQAVRGPTASMPLSIGMNPRSLPLKAFRDNIAHSNGKHGVRTYPDGYMPSQEAIFYNTLSYKNKWDGFFFHNTRDVAVDGGVVADNNIQIDIDRADNVRVVGTSVMGVSPQYKATTDSQNDAPVHADSIIGIELHGFTTSMERSGATISGVTFSGFNNTGSSKSALIAVDDELEHGHFDFWTTLQGISIDSSVNIPFFDFSRAHVRGITNVYITDLDSSMRPSGVVASGTSTVLSNTPEMTHFLDTSQCGDFPDKGFLYCPNTCLRTVLFTVNPAETEGFVLRITEEGNDSNSFDFQGKYYYETLDGNVGPDMEANTLVRKGRYFAPALPPGKYVASFRRNSIEDWPTHAEITVEDAQCQNVLGVGSVNLVPPSPTGNECDELIRNGNLESSDTDFPHWLHHQAGLELVRNKGMGNSNALADVKQSFSNRLIGQYVDTRCMQEGRQYEVQVWVKMERNGVPFSCDSSSSCPRAKLRIRTPTDASGSTFSEANMDIADYFVRPYNYNGFFEGWNLLQGVFTVDSVIASGSSVLFFVEPRVTGVKTFIDDVSVKLLPHDCSQLVLNGDFADGTSRFWEENVDDNSVKLSVVSIGIDNNALEMSGRSALKHTPIQKTRTGCMNFGERFIATARFRLLNPDGSLFNCDATRPTGDLGCPRAKLRSFIDVGLPTQSFKDHDGGSVAVTDHGKTPDGWYTMSGAFYANDHDAIAEKSEVFFDQVSSFKRFLIDDVSIIPLPRNCNQLLLNSDAEYGPTPSFWRQWTNSGGSKLELMSTGNGNNALKLSNRGTNSGDGLHQFIDASCLEARTVWKFTAKMKLVDKSTGVGVTCDPADSRVVRGCPPTRLAGWSGGLKVTDQKKQMTNRPVWSADEFNTYEVEFAVNNALANSDRVSIAIRSYNAAWDLIVDDLTLTPLG